eukprot:4305947-Prymnesium_polylepis.1
MEAAWVRLLALGHARALLAQASMRCTVAEWDSWCAARSWELAGFGLPCWVCFRLVHPLVGLALLEVMHGAAAVFWWREQQRGQGGGAGRERVD